MSEPRRGWVRVRLASNRDQTTHAEFEFPEADLARRLDEQDVPGHAGTIAHQAAETAFCITELAAEGVSESEFPPGYVEELEALHRAQPAMGVGAYAEVTRASGARSGWCYAGAGWDLVERQSAAMAQRAAEQAEGQQADTRPEAER
jgi:hypothetical protein